jgi:spore germination cell wall hydrolase CwlJ-like protein
MGDTNMKAVDILCNVENYFDRNHNLFLKFGFLFSVFFFGLFVPHQMITKMSAEIQAHQNANDVLSTQVRDMSLQVEFLNLSYEKQRRIRTEVECLAKNIYFEAGSEPRAGKIAVAEVTMNRVRSKQFPKTVCGVVYQRHGKTCQFSWVCQGKQNIRSNRTWNESYKIAENILILKKRYGIIGSAKYFHANYVEPNWAAEKQIVMQIGQHIFYH